MLLRLWSCPPQQFLWTLSPHFTASSQRAHVRPEHLLSSQAGFHPGSWRPGHCLTCNRHPEACCHLSWLCIPWPSTSHSRCTSEHMVRAPQLGFVLYNYTGIQARVPIGGHRVQYPYAWIVGWTDNASDATRCCYGRLGSSMLALTSGGLDGWCGLSYHYAGCLPSGWIPGSVAPAGQADFWILRTPVEHGDGENRSRLPISWTKGTGMPRTSLCWATGAFLSCAWPYHHGSPVLWAPRYHVLSSSDFATGATYQDRQSHLSLSWDVQSHLQQQAHPCSHQAPAVRGSRAASAVAWLWKLAIAFRTAISPSESRYC